jgi:regulator of replication initiation timing
VVRAAVRDRVIDANTVLATIVGVLPSTKETDEEIEALKTHITNLAEENQRLDTQLERYENFADHIQEAITAWKNEKN